MSLVVDDQDVLRGSHLAQHFADIGFIVLCAALVHTAFLPNLFVGFPIQLVPVADEHPAGLTLSQFVFEARRNDLEFCVIVAERAGTKTCSLFLTVRPGAMSKMF